MKIWSGLIWGLVWEPVWGGSTGHQSYATWSGPQAHSAAAIVVLPQMCLARRLRLCMRTAA